MTFDRTLIRRATRGLAVAATLAIGMSFMTTAPAQAAPSPLAVSGACSAAGVTVTPLHRPVGASYRPFYADFASKSTLHSNYAGYRISGPGIVPSNTWIKISSFTGGKLKVASGQGPDPTQVAIKSHSTANGAPGDPLAYAYLTATAKSSNTNDTQEFEVEVYNGDPTKGGTAICFVKDGFSMVDDIIASGANKVTGLSVTVARPAVGTTFTAYATGNSGTRGAGPPYDQDAGNGVFSMTPSMSDTWPAKVYQLTGLTLAITGGSTFQDRVRLYPPGSNNVAYKATYQFYVGGTTGSPTLFQPRQDIASGTQVKYTGSFSSNFYLSAPIISISMSKAVTAIENGGPGDDTVTYTVVATNTGLDAGTLSAIRDSLVRTGSVTGATYVPGSTKLDGAAYADPAITAGGSAFRWNGPFTVPGKTATANGSITLTYKVHVTGTPGTLKNSVVGEMGDDTVFSPAGTAATVTFDDSFPVITTATLPLAPLNTPYSSTITAAGGAGGPYSNFTVASGSLPAGLTLDPATGVISGTPTVPGDYTFSVTAKDKDGNTSPPQQLTLFVPAPPPVITTPSVPDGTQGVAYSAPLAATDGIGPYSWDISDGALPDGLSLDPVTGIISGTPTTPGTYDFTARVTDANGVSSTKPYSMTIAADPAALAITTPSLPDGTEGSPYSATLEGTGGTGPYTWAVDSGSLPPGLTLDPATGEITGTPTATGTFPVTFSLTDANGNIAFKELPITIPSTPLAITTNSLPAGTEGSPYSKTVEGTGGTGPYTWSLASGTLPPGLSLDPDTGEISGTPTTPGTYPLTLKLTDANGDTTTKDLPITIVGKDTPLEITTNSLPGGMRGTPYSAPVDGIGGTGPYTWSISTGSLPAGLTMDPATGIISGTPTESGSFPITVKLVDSTGAVTYKSLTLPVGGPLEITTPTLPSGTRGTPYVMPVEGAGGVGPYTWAVTGGSLPPGLTMDPATGVISGTPTRAGDFPITVTLTDKDGVTATKNYVVPINEPAPLVITTDQLPSGTAGTPYTSGLAADGGKGPYTWSIPDGALPAGLTLDPATGLISGTPTTPGTYTFLAKVTDANGDVTEKPFTISIGARTPLQITTTALPGGFVGDPYSTPVEAIGGTGPYTWDYVSGTLPPGLTLNPSTGVISGTPTVPGTYPVTFRVTDDKGVTDLRTLDIVVNGPLSIITDTMPVGETGSPYSAPIDGVGGVGPYAWAIVGGSLPPGLTLDPATGVVSGTPTKGGSYPITVQLTDSTGRVVTKELVIPVNTRAPLDITTAGLPAGQAGDPYVASLDADGGKGPYLWRITDGALPPGMTLDPLTGVVSGTPTKGGTYCFTAQVTDVDGQTKSKVFCLGVGEVEPLVITTPSLPAGEVGDPYRDRVNAVGGDGGPYTFTLAGGSLPPGLTLNPDGTITGTPTVPGRYSITVEARDASGAVAYHPYVIVIPEPAKPAIITPALPPAEKGEPYDLPLEGSGGAGGPYRWDVTEGALPPGMTLGPDGVVSGTPTTPGTYTFTVTLTDDKGNKTSQEYSIVVVPPGAPAITNPTIPGSDVGDPYSDRLVAEGGAGGPYTFELISGDLPPGVTLAPDGSLSGTPTKPGTYEITVRVYDKYGNWSVRTYTITIGAKKAAGLRIVKLVSAGNSMRTGGVVISVECVTPKGKRVKEQRTLAKGQTSLTWTVDVAAGSRCEVTETSTGAPVAKKINPTWNGEAWPVNPSSGVGTLVVGESAEIGSNYAAASASAAAPCSLADGTLTASASGSCRVTWSLAGGVVNTRVKWAVERSGQRIDSGTGRSVDAVRTAMKLTTVTLDNSYQKRTAVAERTVTLVDPNPEPTCAITATPAESLVRDGRTVAVTDIQVSEGCTPPKVKVECVPITRAAPGGDVTYCTWVLKGDRLIIKTNGERLQVTVELKSRPEGGGGPAATWRHVWYT